MKDLKQARGGIHKVLKDRFRFFNRKPDNAIHCLSTWERVLEGGLMSRAHRVGDHVQPAETPPAGLFWAGSVQAGRRE